LQSHVVSRAQGTLRRRDADADRCFARGILPRTTAIRDARALPVPLRALDDHRHVAHVLPLASGARHQAGAAYAASRDGVRAQSIARDTVSDGGDRQPL